MIELNRTALGLAAGIAATTIIGYCIYFDKKRRSDPDYKKKVRERRRRVRQNAKASKRAMPDLNDSQAIERYFLEEIQLGETLITAGEFEEGVEHLANALVVCGQPTKLLEVVQSALPSQVFAMLIMKMQEMASRAGANADAERGPRIVVASSSAAAAAAAANPLDFAASTNAMIDALE